VSETGLRLSDFAIMVIPSEGEAAMKIADIRTHLLSVPFAETPKTGFLDLTDMDLLIVEVETDTGVVGTGYLHPLAPGLRTLDMCVREILAPVLIGEPLDRVERLWQKMWTATFIQGRMGLSVMAMSALDMALWDAVARAKYQPLWRLWGGRPDPVPAYGSGCYRGLGHDGMIDKALRFVGQGYTAIKMQVAHVFTHDEDVANVRDMRAALGDDIEIMVDVNQGWTVEEAITVGRKLDEYGLSWLEEPVMADDAAGYHRIADAIETPLAGGENNFTHHDFVGLLEGGKVPFVQPDLMRGGYTDLRIIGERAQQVGAVIAPHLFPELSIHLNASLPNGSWLECMGWHDHLWTQPLVTENGHITPPDRPGHGMTFKPELFQDFAVTG